jgi:hypothetical protein
VFSHFSWIILIKRGTKKIVMKRITKIIRQNGQSIELQKNNVDHGSNVRSKGLVNEVQDYKSKDLRSKKN